MEAKENKSRALRIVDSTEREEMEHRMTISFKGKTSESSGIIPQTAKS